MKLKTKGPMTVIIPLPPIKKICHWCLEVLSSNPMDKVSKDLPLKIFIILKTKKFCLLVTVIFS